MRCKFREQASTAIQSQADNLSFAMTQVRQCIGKTQKAALAVLLGLGGVWVTLEVISPQVAQADTKRLDLTIERQPNETYETLLRRAEAAAKAAAQASFDQDDQVTDVSVIMVGQNQGSLAPVLSLEVSRPNAQSGVKYFTSARALLKFEDIATTTPDQNRTNSPATSPRRTTRTSGQNRTTSPTTSPGQTSPGQTPNSTSGQPGTINPTGTPGQTPNNTFGQPGTVNPTTQPNNTENPVQTPPPGAGMAPQAPMTPSGNSQSPTSPNVNSFPSSTPTSGSQNPVAAPSSTSGTTINNPSPTSVPNSSSNPIAPTAPSTVFPGGVNSTPNATPNLNVIPDESSVP